MSLSVILSCFENLFFLQLNHYWSVIWSCSCLIMSFMYFQAPASLLLSWLSSLHPALSSSPTKPLWSVCPVSLCLLQMWPGCLVGIQWAVGSLPAPLSRDQTRLSKSAALWPSRNQTGTWIRFMHVKCLWALRLQRKPSTSPNVLLKNSRGPEWSLKIFIFIVCAVCLLKGLHIRKRL